VVIEPIYLTKPRIECVWHHESNNFKCVAMDVLCNPTVHGLGPHSPMRSPAIPGSIKQPLSPSNSASVQYIHTALFVFNYLRGSAAKTDASCGASCAHPPNSGAFSPVATSGKSHKVYSIDIGGDAFERKQLEVGSTSFLICYITDEAFDTSSTIVFILLYRLFQQALILMNMTNCPLI
jgi:hypothetical protein